MTKRRAKVRIPGGIDPGGLRSVMSLGSSFSQGFWEGRDDVEYGSAHFPDGNGGLGHMGLARRFPEPTNEPRDDVSASKIQRDPKKRLEDDSASYSSTNAARTTAAHANLRILEEAVSGGTPRVLSRVLARLDAHQAVLTLMAFQKVFSNSGNSEWGRNNLLENPEMFLVMRSTMEHYLGVEEVAKFDEMVNMRDRFRLVDLAAGTTNVQTICKIMRIFPQQGVDWIASERIRDYRILLLEAVRSRSLVMFDRVVDILGGQDELLVNEASKRLVGGIDHWSIQHLYTASLGGNIEIFNRLTKMYPQAKDALTSDGKWRLLDAAVKSGSAGVFDRVVEFVGTQDMFGALNPRQKSVRETRILQLLREAIGTKQIEMVVRVVTYFPEEGNIAGRFRGVLPLKSAVSSGDLAFFQSVAEILGDEAIDHVIRETGISLLGSAIHTDNAELVVHIMDILGDEEVETTTEKEKGSLLMSSIRSGNMELFKRIEKYVGRVAVDRLAKKDGSALLRSAIGSGNSILVEHVVDVLGEEAVKNAIARDGTSLLDAAIGVGDILLLERIIDIMGREAMEAAAKKDGVSLLRSATRVGDIALFDIVHNLLRDELKATDAKDGLRLLVSAVDIGNIALVERLAEVIGDTVIKGVATEDADWVLGNAVRTGNVDLVKRVAEILGETAMEIISVKDGGAFLRSGIRGGDYALVESFGTVFSSTALGIIIKKDGDSLFEAVVRSGNLAFVETLEEFLGKEVAKVPIGAKIFQFLMIAIRTGDMALFDHMVKLAGETVIKGAIKYEMASPSAMNDEDGPLLDCYVETFAETAMKLAAERGGESLFALVTCGVNVPFLRRVLQDIQEKVFKHRTTGDMETLRMSRTRDAYDTLADHVLEIFDSKVVGSLMETDGISLLESAIRRGDVAVVESYVETLADTVALFAVEKDTELLRVSEMRDAYETLVTRIMDILEETAMKISPETDGLALLRAAIRSCSRSLVDRVVDNLGKAVVEIIVKKGASSLLVLALRGGDLALIEHIVDIIGHGAVEAAIETDGASLFITAIRRGNVALLDRVVGMIRDRSVGMFAGSSGVTAIISAIRAGNVILVDRVINLLGQKAVENAVERNGVLLFRSAIRAGNAALVDHVVDLLGDRVTTPTEDGTSVLQEGLHEIAGRHSGGVGPFTKLLEILSKQPHLRTDVAKVITNKQGKHKISILGKAVAAGNVEVVQAALARMNKDLAPWQVVEACTSVLQEIRRTDDLDDIFSRRAMETQSILLQFGAMPKSGHIARQIDLDEDYRRWRTCFLNAVCLAPNPFIPGVNLLVVLSQATRRAPEGKRTALENLRQDVTRLLLEILEQLPKTVAAFPGNMETCESLFETQTMEISPTGFSGPLGIALQHRRTMETLCPRPLVLDFMSNRFNRGLLPRQNLDNKLPIEVRLLITSNRIYKVPRWRMAFDLEVYLIVVAVYSSVVLLHENAPPMAGEQLFIIYIVAAFMIEVNEMRRDPVGYFHDRWNVLDLLAIILMFAGWLLRMTEGESPSTKGFYALSAPLIFARVLYFAEFLPFQGPMIQVIFSMTGELLQFGVVMLVIIFGFAISLLALYDDVWQDYTYGRACLDLFEAMLGEVGLLEDIAGTESEAAGTILLLVYLVVMTIMLLNLLIAVLSTAHSYVHENSTVEYKVSKARIIQHYVLAVKHDLLPAPFNLFQLILSLPFGLVDLFSEGKSFEWFSWAREHVGMVMFWMSFGPVIVALGPLTMTFAQLQMTVKQWYKNSVKSGPSELLLRLVVLPLMSPAWLLLSWLQGGVQVVRSFGGTFCGEASPSPSAQPPEEPALTSTKLASILENSPEGLSVAQLQRYLDDPMSDPVVRQDERTQSTKVEHLKLLRDRLEKTFDSKGVEEGLERVNTKVGDLEGIVKSLATEMKSLEVILRTVSEKLGSWELMGDAFQKE